MLATAGLVPVELRCSGQVDPLAASAAPVLSWRAAAQNKQRAQVQSAWRILVASSRDKLDHEDGDLWDSGKVAATRSPRIKYAGNPLTPGQRCYWKVMCWDQEDQPSEWSEVASWEVAPLQPADWQGARWIDDGKENPTQDAEFYQDDPAPLLRREFALSKPVVRARLHVAGLGLCYPSLNGERIKDQVFDPPWTDFSQRIHFRTHDVTAQLQAGANCIGLSLGNGWYNPLPLRMWGRRNLRDALPVGRPRAIACLIIEHPDGSQTVVTTGRDWTTSEGPTIRNNLYLGEVRDARKAIPGWDRGGFDATDWHPVNVTDHSLQPLQPLSMPPVRLEDPFPAKTITSPKPDVYIVDFGKNFTGLPEIDLDVPAGTKITMRFGELLYPDGSLNPMTSVCGQIKGTRELEDGSTQSVGGPGAPEIAWQQNVYIARGGGPETYRPDFTFHGFRYMEISGLPAAPEPEDCRGYLMKSDLESAGSFSCSNDLLNRIQQVCRNTFLTNVVSVQSDCPHRERFGYGGDIVATSEAFLMNFEMAGFYTKTVRDWADGVLPDGRLVDTAPSVGMDYCGVGWAMVHPLLLEQLYQHYGQLDLIEEQLPVALRWLEAEAARREQGLVVTGLGDHEALIPAKGPEFTTPMFVAAAQRVARLARLVDREEDAKRMEQLADESASAWIEKFLDSGTGKVAAGTQSALTFALGFETVPAASRDQVFARLVEDLTRPEDSSRLSTGIYGTFILLEMLPRMSRNDLAYALATRTTFPSWGWMLENDATTLWEAWEGTDGSRSHNHPMFGSISAYFFRWLGGIQVAPDAVGFDRVLIRPQVVPGLEWVKCSHDSIRGTITSNWTQTEDAVTFEITIPPDTTAVIELPVADPKQILESGQSLNKSDSIKLIPFDKGSGIRIQAGSGHYHFTATTGKQS